MTEAESRAILGTFVVIQEDGSLEWANSGPYAEWWKSGNEIIILDGDFTADQLEAIAWWMRNHK